MNMGSNLNMDRIFYICLYPTYVVQIDTWCKYEWYTLWKLDRFASAHMGSVAGGETSIMALDTMTTL